MRCAAEIKRRHYNRNIARSFKWMGYILLLKKKTLRSFYTQMHKRFTYKCSGLRYAPDVLLLLLFKRRDHFTPITYTMGFKTDTKVKICVQVGNCKLLAMYECPRLHWKKKTFSDFCCSYTSLYFN